MANQDAPSGFNPVGKIGSGPASKMAEYKVTNSALFQGDIVKLASGLIALLLILLLSVFFGEQTTMILQVNLFS